MPQDRSEQGDRYVDPRLIAKADVLPNGQQKTAGYF
jgi:hypothetical protein